MEDMLLFIDFINNLVNDTFASFLDHVDARYYFNHGGCLEFAEVLQNFFPKGKIQIRKDFDHFVFSYNDILYDTNGRVKEKEDYFNISKEDIENYKERYGRGVKFEGKDVVSALTEEIKKCRMDFLIDKIRNSSLLGTNKEVNRLFSYLDDETKEEIEDFVEEEKDADYEKENDLTKETEEFLSCLTEEEFLDLRTYTGYHFRDINAVLRDNWTYQENGMLSNEKRLEYLSLAERISSIIKKYPECEKGFTTYRGVNLNAFKKYHITSLEQLIFLKDHYMYEEGFTSSSISPDSSYFGRGLADIEITYLIPKGSKDGCFLLDDNLSYSKNQKEYLLDKGCLTKVVDVKIDKENQKAYLRSILIPKEKWNEKKDVIVK